MTHIQPAPHLVHQGEQIQAAQAEILKIYRMFRDDTIRDKGEYVGNGTVFVALVDAEVLTREKLVQLLMEAMRQLDAAGVPVDGLGVGGLDVI